MLVKRLSLRMMVVPVPYVSHVKKNGAFWPPYFLQRAWGPAMDLLPPTIRRKMETVPGLKWLRPWKWLVRQSPPWGRDLSCLVSWHLEASGGICLSLDDVINPLKSWIGGSLNTSSGGSLLTPIHRHRDTHTHIHTHIHTLSHLLAAQWKFKLNTLSLI